MSTSAFLVTRVVHVMAAALWLGAVFFVSMFLMPVLQQSGKEAGAIMGRLEGRGLVKFFASVSGLTLLSGLVLYWHLTAGFDAATSATTSAKVFGAGGVLGIIAGIIGGAVVGRSAKRAAVLTAQIASMPEGKERATIAAEIQALRGRMAQFGGIVVVLLLITIALMAVGHYV